MFTRIAARSRSAFSLREGRRGALSLLLMVAAASSTAGAHSVQAPRAAHGGVAQAASNVHLELLLEDGRASLYVYDRQNHPLAIDDATAVALLWLESGSLALDLVSDGTALVSKGEFVARSVRRVTLELRLSGRDPVSAWFSLRAPDASQPARVGNRGASP